MTNATNGIHDTPAVTYRGLHQRQFRAMGTEFDVWVATEDRQQAQGALGAAQTFVAEAEAVMSRFRPESELSSLNGFAGTEVWVSDLLFEAITAALDAAKATSGLYDPTLLKAVVGAGYDRTFEEVAARASSVAPVAGNRGRWQEVRVDAQRRRVRLPSGAGLDLGGIGKAWTAQVIADELAKTGPCIVSAGGDVAVRGELYPGERWPVAIADPFGGEASLKTVELKNCGVATSGIDRRRWSSGSVTAHHLIDPRTGLPAATDLMAVTVVARDTLRAEAFALAAMVAGREEALALLAAERDLWALLIGANGTQSEAGHDALGLYGWEVA